jgi:hypothetical protein
VWRAAAAGQAAAGKVIIRLVDRLADTGSESVVGVLPAQAGCAVLPQVRIPFTDLERLDLLVSDHLVIDHLVSDHLVIECDSEAHHRVANNDSGIFGGMPVSDSSC